MPPAIEVRNVGKRYRMGRAERASYGTLRDALVNAAAGTVRRLRGRTHAGEDFWALNELSFDVEPGEVVGIIGRNGAGKSTLLKIISRITKPTTGRIALRGRVGSLLEVGTGFHPELTGRENVYLNGGILGMSRREIDRNFDAIVDFSGVGPFLDTPVKRYSSGMQVRLAFAVAAHLDPEILIIDEVLAVGDATYQKRCLDRMTELAYSGKTILFVSHNMDIIPRLCSRAFLLDSGRLVREGGASEVANYYLESQLDDTADADLSAAVRTGDGRARFVHLSLVNADGERLLTHASGDDLRLRIGITASRPIQDVALAIVLSTLSGARVITSWTREVGFPIDLHDGVQWFDCCFREARLRPGHAVNISLWMESQGVIDSIANARIVHVAAGQGAHLSTDSNQGIVALDYAWSRCEDACVAV